MKDKDVNITCSDIMTVGLITVMGLIIFVDPIWILGFWLLTILWVVLPWDTRGSR